MAEFLISQGADLNSKTWVSYAMTILELDLLAEIHSFIVIYNM